MSSDVKVLMEPGHYYSPIVNPAEIRQMGYFERQKSRPLLDLNLDYQLMFGTFSELIKLESGTWIPRQKQRGYRYYSDNDYYRFGDAVILSGMIQKHAPSNIVEVGSGFSSAVMLDTLDKLSRKPNVAKSIRANCTFIDPFPDRLDQILRASDKKHVRVIREFVQDVDLNEFSSLTANDILFLDTTHVSKTCSDVNFEVFEILPRLQSGVIIHFHDVFHNFEYPEYWVFTDNRSWNEIYLLRALLMNNKDYDVIMINDSIAALYPEDAQTVSSRFMENAGGGLWLRKN